MLEKVKFKYLQGIVDGDVDYPSIMTEVFNFKNNRIGRKLVFAWKFKKSYQLIKSIEDIDPKTIEYSESCRIKRPKSIDYISYKAMLQAQALSGNPNDLPIVDLMTELIAIVCFEENHKSRFDTDSKEFKNFKNHIKNSSMLEMLGLFNWIDKAIEDSTLLWEKRFMKVHIDDPDYLMAGGMELNNFNVINTLKTICRDFNITIDEAWQQSYALVQTNSLSQATANFVQEQMRLIKEARMRQQRNGSN